MEKIISTINGRFNTSIPLPALHETSRVPLWALLMLLMILMAMPL